MVFYVIEHKMLAKLSYPGRRIGLTLDMHQLSSTSNLGSQLHKSSPVTNWASPDGLADNLTLINTSCLRQHPMRSALTSLVHSAIGN